MSEPELKIVELYRVAFNHAWERLDTEYKSLSGAIYPRAHAEALAAVFDAGAHFGAAQVTGGA